MIYTITFNPSLDYVVYTDCFEAGKVNRTSREVLFPGGKGINVSIVLKNLGMDSVILGFSAGFTGKEIRRRLAELGCKEALIELPEGCSRINVKIKSAEETEVNGMGPDIDERSLSRFFRKLESLRPGDVLVIAGSISSSLPKNIYQDILAFVEGKGVLTVVDATGALLTNVLPGHPFLVKPNHHELGEIFGVTIETREQAAEYARKLQKQGARNVLVSMAGEGAVLVTEDGHIYKCNAPKGEVVNSVGAGDSMVAGFLYGYLARGSYRAAFGYGLAAGSASAFEEGLADRRQITRIYDQLQF